MTKETEKAVGPTETAPISLSRLRSVAEGVPEAAREWRIVEYGDGDSLVIHSDDDNRVCFMATPGGSKGSWEKIQALAAFIESHDPATVLTLLDIAEKARELMRCADGEHLSEATIDALRSALKGIAP